MPGQRLPPIPRLTSQVNKPLVICGKDGSGKKHLLANWIKFHCDKQTKGNKRYKDFIIPHYHSGGGNDKSYSYALFNVLIKLKVSP